MAVWRFDGQGGVAIIMFFGGLAYAEKAGLREFFFSKLMLQKSAYFWMPFFGYVSDFGRPGSSHNRPWALPWPPKTAFLKANNEQTMNKQ
jgi:hypothetical protein